MSRQGSGFRFAESLFARVYAFALGVAGLLLLALTGAMVAVVLPAEDADSRQGIRWAAEQLLRLRADPAALAAAAGALRTEVGLELTLYGADGAVLATNVEPLLPLPAAGGTPVDGWVVPIDGGAVAVARDLEPIDLTVGAGRLALGLGVLALAAWPVARSVTRPLARLGDVVERFGDGDLAARSGRSSGGDEVGQLSARFDQMADRIAALLGEERLWMAGMSHEFRTPLHRLRLALDNAEDQDGRLSAAELDAIRQDVVELDELVADVLAAARFLVTPVAARIPRREPVDLSDVTRAACARAGLEAPEVASVVVVGDRRLLTRAVLNLLRNAREHARGAPVAVQLVVGQGTATIRVSDRGPGVASSHRASVWAPFDRGALAPEAGRGLGLALVRQIAETHGGRATLVDDAPGAVFELELPTRAG